jgi:hypothetical protein
VSGAEASVALEQFRRREEQERQHQAIGLGQVERPLERPRNPARVAEGIERDGPDQQRPDRPHGVVHGGVGVVEDGRERRGGVLRRILRQHALSSEARRELLAVFQSWKAR